MKKNKKAIIIKIAVLVAVLIGGAIFAFSFFSDKFYNLVVNKLSEVRYDLSHGQVDDVRVTLMSGMREKDYLINGFSTQTIEFGVVTFYIDEEVNFAGVGKYVLTVGTTRYDGDLEKNPYDGSYVADTGRIINHDNEIIAKIMLGDYIKEVPLTRVTNDWKVSWQEALKIACNSLKDELETFMQNGDFAGEGYVKIINDKSSANSEYFWYVSFVNRDKQTVAVIINPMTKEVLAKKGLR